MPKIRIKDAAAYLNVSDDTVRRWIEAGTLPAETDESNRKVVDGYALAQQLRQDPRTAGIKLIAVSGYGRDEDKRLAREVGFDFHLTKPVDPEVLANLLAGGERG